MAEQLGQLMQLAAGTMYIWTRPAIVILWFIVYVSLDLLLLAWSDR